MQKAPDPNRQQRRSRNDQDGRDFHCGCGKSYLSYTALYTHVKVKHRGKTPEGTKIVHASSNPSKKERPSKSARKSVERRVVRRPKIGAKPAVAPSLEETFDSNSDSEQIKEMLNKYEWLERELGRSDEYTGEKTCQCVLAEHAYEMINKMDVDQVKSFLLLLDAFKQAVDIYFYETVALYEECKKMEEFSMSEHVNYLPQMANCFVTIYLPLRRPELDREQAIEFMFNLCKWLKKKNYTTISVTKK
eukprot:TRINITY_DN14356_c0_g1_i3.p1 TRINITY_DN14356_c0_g1~~TRINITY_DN14356_c0_g1_i3.p1  ORF type:complete len:247 (+),score=55.83 TRINITY_DN14356_c0_g1_i3:138-878(+)